jgi:hypothetical protein
MMNVENFPKTEIGVKIGTFAGDKSKKTKKQQKKKC